MIERIRQALYRNRKTLSVLTGSQVVNIILGFGNSILWTRGFSQETYGSYQFILSAFGIISSFCLVGLSQSASISAAKAFDGNFRVLIRIKSFAAIGGTLALLIYAAYLWRDGQRNVGTTLALTSPLLFAFILPDVTVPWINAKRSFGLLSISQVIPAFFSFSVLAIATYFESYYLLPVALGIQGLTALSNLYIGWKTARTLVKNEIRDEKIVHYGYHASIASLLGWVIYVDRFLIHEKLSATDLAIYSVAMIFPGQIKTFYSVASQFITPEINETHSFIDAWIRLRFKLLSLLTIFTLTGTIGFFAVEFFIPVLFSEKYAIAASFGGWLIFAFAISAPAAFFGNIIRAQQKKAFYYGYEILQPLITLGLYAILLPHGLTGMVWAQVIRQIFFGAVMIGSFFYYLNREKIKSSGLV